MKEPLDTGCGCGSDCSSNEGCDTRLESTGVSIMPEMDDAGTDGGIGPKNVFADHEKPGYIIGSFVEDFVFTDTGFVPKVKTKPDKSDILSTLVVRSGIGRHNYKVAPGLYCVGNPDKASEVLVTANFKLTFDHLRRELEYMDAWILVLDTGGVNVWCAAGKGTFSTGELVKRIKRCSLEKVVDHKRVIVPQLGATGVTAGKVKKESGFKVVFGPVRAKDIPAFVKNNRKADKKMRMVTFTFIERLILTPVELKTVLKPALLASMVLIILSGFGPGFFSFSSAFERGMVSILALLVGIISGAVITPALLPYIPFREFAAKGLLCGIVFAALLFLSISSSIHGITAFIGLFLLVMAISSYLSMNFTGATPFTSPSGVEKEMKRFIPVQLIALVISTGFWIYSAF
ncbi:MAG: mercury methylation corrinoid protein HgcA [Thermodesulfobacteriota bacterium]|nr:mercury methylation corrinoid protein HgcA [Thermodesulfobacteriota bacterium]